jgi:hypothetical protein
VPPKEGSTNLANIGSIKNRRAALKKIVKENSAIIIMAPEKEEGFF